MLTDNERLARIEQAIGLIFEVEESFCKSSAYDRTARSRGLAYQLAEECYDARTPLSAVRQGLQMRILRTKPT